MDPVGGRVVSVRDPYEGGSSRIGGRRTLASIGLAVVCLSTFAPSQALASHTSTTQLSVGLDGRITAYSNTTGYGRSMSPDARFVVFQSHSENLVRGDANGQSDVFVVDRASGLTTIESVSSAGVQGDNFSAWGSITPDGRYVAFLSYAKNLVPGDTNGVADVFVRDRLTGTTVRASLGHQGQQADNHNDSHIAISDDGRFVAFVSKASNLVPQSLAWSEENIFLRDILAGTTEIVSYVPGASGWHASDPSMSADGRYVVFAERNPLVPSDTNGVTDVYRYDRLTGTYVRVSVSGDGTQGNGASFWASITPDANIVAFVSNASNLSGPGAGYPSVFVRNLVAGTTERVSIPSNGREDLSRGYPGRVSISGNGAVVAFEWGGYPLVPDADFFHRQIYVRDRSLGLTALVSRSTSGESADDDSALPDISFDGSFVVFMSHATNLSEEQDPGAFDIGSADVFLRDRGPSTCTNGAREEGWVTTQTRDGVEPNSPHPVTRELECSYLAPAGV